MSALMVKSGRRYRTATLVEMREALTACEVREIRGTVLAAPEAARTFIRNALASHPYECFAVLWLDNRHRVITWEILFRGTIDRSAVYPREILRQCLTHNAAACIIAHNHPSGVLEPSQADELITRRIKECLALIDARVLDHFIVSSEGVFSFSEHGLL